MFSSPPGPARRALVRAIGAGAAAGTLAGTAGCSVGSTVDSLRPSPLPTPAAPTNPDLVLAAQVAETVASADHQAPAAFAQLHRAQLARFPEHGAIAVRSARGSWQSRQKALVDTLADAALQASDPDLVSLLASMAAAQRQLLTARGVA